MISRYSRSKSFIYLYRTLMKHNKIKKNHLPCSQHSLKESLHYKSTSSAETSAACTTQCIWADRPMSSMASSTFDLCKFTIVCSGMDVTTVSSLINIHSIHSFSSSRGPAGKLYNRIFCIAHI